MTTVLHFQKVNFARIINQLLILLVFASLMLSFVLTSWFLSMWISNTATTAMMIPIVEAVLEQMEQMLRIDLDKGMMISSKILLSTAK